MKHVRAFLLSSGSLDDLQLYVAMIIGIRLFLRSDELLKLTVDEDTVNSSVTLVNPEGFLTRLALTVKGTVVDITQE
jgi:hypothetical protein